MVTKTKFKIIGAAEAAANLLCEFKIAPKKEDRLTNIKKGKVILVKVVANSNFLVSSMKPGAISPTKIGIKISIMRTKKNKAKNNKLKTSLANLFDLDLFLTNSEVQLGTKAELKVPSAKSLLKVFGILKATKKASAKKLVPRKIAIKTSLKYPSNLLIIV